MAYSIEEYSDVSVLTELLEKAGVQGYLTSDDIADICEDSEQDSDWLNALLSDLDSYGVDIIDEEEEQVEEVSPRSLGLPAHANFDPLLSLERVSPVDTVGLYLREMSRVPLLSADEEISLAQRIERATKSKKALANLNGRVSRLRRRELNEAIQDGILAREHLIKANTRLVVSIAKKYISRGVPFLDLIQEGNLGLMKAVEKYDYRRGFRFSTYATWWIRQTITRAIAEQSRTIRVPVHMIDRIRQMYKTAHEMEQDLGRPPTPVELALKLELDPKKVQWMLRVSWLPLSLDSPVGDEDDSELGMFVEDDTTPTPTQTTYQKMLKEKVEEVLATLSPREARILRLRFGLENGRAYTLEEVGQKFGLTRERIRQIEGKALRRLRHPRRARQLKEYL